MKARFLFARIDLDILDHPKAFQAGVDGFGLWAWSVVYCRKHLTNGHIPECVVLAALGGKGNAKIADRLVACGLWERGDVGVIRVHNYEAKNETRDDVEERRAGERLKKRAQRSSETAPRLSFVPGDNRGDNGGTSQGTHYACPPLVPVSDSVSVSVSPEGVQGEPRPPTAAPKRRATACPTSEAEAGEVVAFAERWKCDAAHAEWPKFLDFHRAKRSVFADWSAAWRNWVRRSAEFAASRPSGTYRNGRIVQQAPESGPIWRTGEVIG